MSREQLYFESRIAPTSGGQSALVVMSGATSPIVTSVVLGSRPVQQVSASSRLAAGETL